MAYICQHRRDDRRWFVACVGSMGDHMYRLLVHVRLGPGAHGGPDGGPDRDANRRINNDAERWAYKGTFRGSDGGEDSAVLA